ncbi:transposase [Clostridiaceae bacterium WCA-383-APC-5B]|uniref:Transposase n=1 Tax=Inconstantimicrobium porci TaxID=2652291 RepID=A0A7X2MYJ1_9CLOT|nr:transposase [Inconstantimicrobium porci]
MPSVFTTLANLRLACALSYFSNKAHLRRYFIDAIPSKLKPSKEITNAEKGRNYCNELFKIEKTLKNMDCDKRKAERVKQEKPVLDAFWCWLESLNPLRGSKLGKAV